MCKYHAFYLQLISPEFYTLRFNRLPASRSVNGWRRLAGVDWRRRLFSARVSTYQSRVRCEYINICSHAAWAGIIFWVRPPRTP